MLAQRAHTAVGRNLERLDAALSLAEAHARAADPRRILARGFSITRTADGRLVRSAADAPDGTEPVTVVEQGTIRSTVGR